jgi:hypothetical protein
MQFLQMHALQCMRTGDNIEQLTDINNAIVVLHKGFDSNEPRLTVDGAIQVLSVTIDDMTNMFNIGKISYDQFVTVANYHYGRAILLAYSKASMRTDCQQ